MENVATNKLVHTLVVLSSGSGSAGLQMKGPQKREHANMSMAQSAKNPPKKRKRNHLW